MTHSRPVVVITGASAGHGRAVARAFARQGADIGLLARGHEGLEAAKREVESLGGRAIAVPVDVADAQQLEAAADTVEREFGPITVWVNNAMASMFAPVMRMRPDEIKRVTDVTYLGAVYGTMAALRRMVPRDRGTIIQVGSALAYRGIPLQAAYCAAKQALLAFTESLRTELLHDKSRVRVTMVQMPAMNTPQFVWTRNRMSHKARPVPPIYQPEAAAETVVWAASHDRREIEVGATTVFAVLANKLLPAIVDRYLARKGYRIQQTRELVDPNQPENLWKPVKGDHGAHGPFDEKALSRSPQVWTTRHRSMMLAAAGLGALAALSMVARRAPGGLAGLRTTGLRGAMATRIPLLRT
ncbi:MAG: SDR family oxidoreductase [Gammaproteobacteria bacterium]|nr:SDR family oxidoreductase [Gammaproteobacteria bacterium]